MDIAKTLRLACVISTFLICHCAVSDAPGMETGGDKFVAPVLPAVVLLVLASGALAVYTRSPRSDRYTFNSRVSTLAEVQIPGPRMFVASQGAEEELEEALRELDFAAADLVHYAEQYSSLFAFDADRMAADSSDPRGRCYRVEQAIKVPLASSSEVHFVGRFATFTQNEDLAADLPRLATWLCRQVVGVFAQSLIWGADALCSMPMTPFVTHAHGSICPQSVVNGLYIIGNNLPSAYLDHLNLSQTHVTYTDYRLIPAINLMASGGVGLGDAAPAGF